MNRNTICATDFIAVKSTETVVPDPGRLIFALRQIGYTFEQAISDLIDNAITAGARNALIRFIWCGERITSVAVADDGCGMTDAELRDAMRFGSDERMDPASLGKFGLGLKLASFSHGRKLTVLTVHGGVHQARQWTIEGIRRNWECDVLDSAQTQELCTAPWSPIDLSGSGTVVVWEDIDKLPTSTQGLRATLRSLHKRLELHLGLHFHRFLQTDSLRIFVDQQEQGQLEHQLRVRIPSLDPFAYPDPPVPGYPRKFLMRVPDVGELVAEGHIWPPNADSPEYKLGNKAAARQGFYFYRNDRLIQAGGWNGVVQNESEPHGSLARVRVDLPAHLDAAFNINVQKSSVIAPPGFVEAAQNAVCDDGIGFDTYRKTAQQVYRKEDMRGKVLQPLVPGCGVHPGLREFFQQDLTADQSEVREIGIVWGLLDEGDFFQLDYDNDRILLNTLYRQEAFAGSGEDLDDQLLVKTLLFTLVSGDLKTSTLSDKRRRELDRINRLLVSAARLGTS